METPKVERRAKGARPYFFNDPAVDKLLAIVMALAGEVSVIRDRLDSVLKLAESRGLFSGEDVEAYVPPAEVRSERDEWREEFLARILRIVEVELEEVAPENTPEAYKEAVDSISRS